SRVTKKLLVVRKPGYDAPSEKKSAAQTTASPTRLAASQGRSAEPRLNRGSPSRSALAFGLFPTRKRPRQAASARRGKELVFRLRLRSTGSCRDVPVL